MIANHIVTSTGRIRAVCEHCGRLSRPVDFTPGWRVNLFDIGTGWSVAPYPPSFVHDDGSTGSLYTCTRCNQRRRQGGHLAPTPKRAEARTARRLALVTS